MQKNKLEEMSWADLVALRNFLNEKHSEIGNKFIMNGYDKLSYEDIKSNFDADSLQNMLGNILFAKNKLDDFLYKETLKIFKNEKHIRNS